MNTIQIVDHQVTIHLSGWDKFFALKGHVSVPIASITHVDRYQTSLLPPWLKSPGTAVPGLVMAGTFRNLTGRKEFWCTYFKGNTLVIDLQNAAYDRIVVDLPKDQAVEDWIAKLNADHPNSGDVES